MNNNIELKELTADSFMEFIKSNLNQIDFSYNHDRITLIKAKYKNSVLVYCNYCYGKELDFWLGFDYAGFYSMVTDTFYDGCCYRLNEILKKHCSFQDTKSLKAEMKTLLSKRIYDMLDNFNNAELREKADKLLNKSTTRDPDWFNTAENLYYRDEKPELSKFYRIEYDFENSSNVMDFCENKTEFIEYTAKTYIEDHLAELYRDFVEFQEVEDEYKKIATDKNNIFHLRKAISDSVEGTKTVNVTILKGNVEFTFKTSSESLRVGRYRDYYSNYDITATDRELFYKTFGRYENYTADEIVKITYCKKIIYKKGEK